MTILAQYPGSMFLPQRVKELRALYYGEPMNYGVKGKRIIPACPAVLYRCCTRGCAGSAIRSAWWT